MTQASLSPDLSGALGAEPSAVSSVRAGRNPEPALWIIALTASGLVLAAVLLLGLLTRSAVGDASFGGFVSGVAIMFASAGVGAWAYVLVTARRQGLLGSSEPPKPVIKRVAPSGMHVVPARPAEMGRRRRQQLELERSVRSKQAKAIAAAASATPPKPRPQPRPMAPAHASRRPAPVGRSAPGPASVRSVSHAPAGSVVRAIRMPQPQLRQPRPAAWPVRAPVVRMAVPSAMPHTQATLQQVSAANVRMQMPSVRR